MTTSRRPRDPDQLRDMVREGYTHVVEERSASEAGRVDELGRRIGYSDDELGAVPEGANLGVGCGNPTAIDRLRPGEFRKGNIEALPVEDESVDAIISNCVINLSPEKERVYREAFRVLRPGGRIMISDVVLERPLPQPILDSIDAYLGCVGGASLRAEYLETIAKAGFREVRVEREGSFLGSISFDDPPVQEAMERLGISEEAARGYADTVSSLHIFAVK